MNRVNNSIFDCVHVIKDDYDYQIIAHDGLDIIDDIIRSIGCKRMPNGNYLVDVYFEIQNNSLVLKKIVAPEVRNLEIFNVTVSKIDKNFVYEDINMIFDNVELIMVSSRLDYPFARRPFHYSYEFAFVAYFKNGKFFDVSSTIKELLSLDFDLYVEMQSPSIADQKFNEIVNKYNYPFDFEEILSFDDYFDFKEGNRGAIDGLLDS